MKCKECACAKPFGDRFECRRKSPDKYPYEDIDPMGGTLLMVGRWPIVEADDWCWDFVIVSPNLP